MDQFLKIGSHYPSRILALDPRQIDAVHPLRAIGDRKHIEQDGTPSVRIAYPQIVNTRHHPRRGERR